MTKVLLTGSSGQLGYTLIKKKPANINLITPNRKELDLSNPKECFEKTLDIKPDWILNCAAYTSVDLAESNQEVCFKVNRDAPKYFAKALNITGGNLIQISTDYVFDGLKSNAYKVNDIVSPLNQYGLSKAKAEKYIKEILGNTNQGIVIRTSWLMGTISKNFLLTMIKLHQTKKEINVVSNQISCPTSTKTLAEACWQAIQIKLEKNLHKDNFMPILHWSDNGVASWYDIALAIGEIGSKNGLIDFPAFVNPIKSENHPRKAKIPRFSLLDCESSRDFLGLKGEYWRKSLEISIKSIVEK